MKQYPMIILAGGPPVRDPLMEYADVDCKALIDISGKPMISYVLDEFHKTGLISYLLIVGKKDELVGFTKDMDPNKVEFMVVEGNAAEKFYQAGMHLLELSETRDDVFTTSSRHIIYATSDIPAAKSNMIKDHIKKCQDDSTDFYYSVVEKADMDAAFPESGRTYMNIEGGKYAGVDLVIVDMEILRDKFHIIKLVTENRKSFLRGLFFASPLTFIKFILGRVKMKDVERLMSKIFGFRSKLIITKDAELGFDVDKPFQLDIMREYF